MSVLNPAKERALTKHIGSVSQVLVFPSFVLGRLLGSPTWITSSVFPLMIYHIHSMALDWITRVSTSIESSLHCYLHNDPKTKHQISMI